MPVAIAASISAVWVAVAILLVAWAAWVLIHRPLVALLAGLPVVGSAVARVVGDGIGALIRWALDWAESAVRPLVEVVAAPVTWLDQVLGWAAAAAEALETAIAAVAERAAARINALWSSLSSLAASLGALRSLLDGTRAWLASVAASVATLTATTIPAAIATAVDRARVVAAGLDAALRSDLLARIAATATTAASALAAAVATLTGRITAVQTWAGGAIAAALATAVGAVATLRRDHDAVLGRQAADIARLTTSLAPLLALELTRVVPQTIGRLDTLERDCIRPTCSVVSPQLRDLEALLDGTTLALVLGLVGAAVANPIGTGRAVAGEAGELRSIATTVVGPTIGLR